MPWEGRQFQTKLGPRGFIIKTVIIDIITIIPTIHHSCHKLRRSTEIALVVDAPVIVSCAPVIVSCELVLLLRLRNLNPTP